MKVAFVHDWLDTYRGGEKVLESLISLYPKAPIYTMFYNPARLPKTITTRDIRYPKHLAPFRRFRKLMLAKLPHIAEAFKLDDFDLVISSSSAVAKGIIPAPWTKHLCYLHSPMRYIWDQREDYRNSLPAIPAVRRYFDSTAAALRIWDTASSTRVSKFVVNSNFVKQRVALYYGRDADVVHPPFDYESFSKTRASLGTPQRGYFLVAGALVPYKKVDLAVRACEALKVPIVVAGGGPSLNKIRAYAKNHTTFVVNPSQEEWCKLLFNAKALLFPGVEDFGLVPLEAMALGTPVVAFGRGGALDYVQPEVNGYFFNEQSTEGLIHAISAFNQGDYSPEKVNHTVQKFDERHFTASIKQHIERLMI